MLASPELSTISSFILLFLAVTSAAFSPPSSVASSHPNNASLLVSTPISTSSLFMNKKKKKRTRSTNSKGFGSGEVLLSPSTSGSATLIKPKTSSSFRYAGSIRPGMQTPKRIVPSEKISFPDYAFDGQPKNRPALFPWVIEVKKPDEIEKMRAAGRCAREVLDLAGSQVQPGITTDEIDRIVHEASVKRGAYPSPLGYHGFPKSCCTSVNEVICHGIPDNRPLQEGDVVNIDITCHLNGYHGDCSEMFVVGGEAAIDSKGRRLLQATYDCWVKAMNFVKPGRDYKDIGAIIEDHVTEQGFTTVKSFCGHGIGSVFHTNPNILHYRNSEPAGKMAPGHTFTIEPMICEGGASFLMWPDDWTATTRDGGRSAQFEHTLLITPDGVEALTAKLESSPVQFWERDSKVHDGFWLGTSQSARDRAAELIDRSV
mmetsp:Transcript_31218/g.75481  ORF Transcript_31218/g.75481 Transcript_31218/m.75481 type:complete len:429 (-) Transcript_31218:279-1565(-)|eukprot:CAMPEP_0181114132 /NCGR_PEP_ID=MMETSP1071-20121207/20715_1 /TAXON_ID=35127 /ORGANISM="Thalassiosira sp., Strain NH16" /LENGTH=428 /DNA_ID=CAMNT_0023198211 /DNA_START=133 /DNA_END=1419 /DNA_ORIENTATION=+